jgi:pantetheine-phosphate adenylyltransferase
MSQRRVALYPGTFDPLTHGHLDVLRRATRLFDEVILAIAPSESKKPWFTLDERLTLARAAVKDIPCVSVEGMPGLTVEFARNMGATVLIRGLRKFSDFEHEFDLAHINRRLSPEIETVILMPSLEQFCTSSSFVKEMARHKPDEARPFVPECVYTALLAKLVQRERK